MWMLASTLAFAEDAPLDARWNLGPLLTEAVMVDYDDPDSLRMDLGAGLSVTYALDPRLTAHLAASGRLDVLSATPGLAVTASLNYRPGGTWVRGVIGAGGHADTRGNFSPALRFGTVAALGRSGWTLETTYQTGGYVFGGKPISEVAVMAGRNL